jgi:hypothetical protein
MTEEQAREITERLFTTSSGIQAAKLAQMDEGGGVIDELDFETVARLIEETQEEGGHDGARS